MGQFFLFPAIALGAVLGSTQAMAQTPLFLDGTAFGGSKVFSEGINPLGNSARFDQPMAGQYATYVDGNQWGKDGESLWKDMGIGAPATTVTAGHLKRLSESPWAIRARSFGFSALAKTINTAFVHETFNSFFAHTDGDPSGVTYADVSRSVVERISTGVGGVSQGSGVGLSLRLERWKTGTERRYLNPVGGQPALTGGSDPLSYNRLSRKALTVALDVGFIFEVSPKVRCGLTVERLNQKHLWDIYERPQARVGIQFDLGASTKVALEMDVNKTQRMPFPVNQRTAAGSIRIEPGSTFSMVLGAEWKEIGGADVVVGGASVRFRTPSVLVGIGFQVGKDDPLKGVVMAVK